MPEYTYNQLRVLWHLKRHGPLVRQGTHSLLTTTADDLSMPASAVRHALRVLEQKSVVLRTYQKPQSHKFGEGNNNVLLRVELVDPRMSLPPCPPLPPAFVMARENEELAERTTTEPSLDRVVEVLVTRALELQKQVDKLHDVVDGLTQENERLKKAAAPPRTHLSAAVKGVLTPEQWDSLRRSS